MTISPSLASAASETVYLESYNAVDSTGSFCSGANLLSPTTPPGCGTEVTAPGVLTSGTSYKVDVSGAVSAWGDWPYRRCGKPDPKSEYASPGRTNEPAGDDAQFRFAQPLLLGKCPKLPVKGSIFQVDLGGGWYHPIADNNPTRPSGDNVKGYEQHPYVFTFVGQGVAPRFRYIDHHPSDNSGRFKIVVTG